MLGATLPSFCSRFFIWQPSTVNYMLRMQNGTSKQNTWSTVRCFSLSFVLFGESVATVHRNSFSNARSSTIRLKQGGLVGLQRIHLNILVLLRSQTVWLPMYTCLGLRLECVPQNRNCKCSTLDPRTRRGKRIYLNGNHVALYIQCITQGQNWRKHHWDSCVRNFCPSVRSCNDYIKYFT